MKQQPSAPHEVLDFRPGADMTWEIVRTDEVFETVNTVGPGTGGPPVHVHPHAEERFEVLEGAIEVLVDGTWRTLGRGEQAVVPPGVPHTVRSHGGERARVVNTHSPALEYEAFFRHFHRLVSTGAIKLPPKDPRSLLHTAVLFSAYPRLQRTVKPPQAVFDALARIGRVLRLRVDA